MKVSYKVLKKYIPHIDTPEKVAQDLIMHTAEVEDIYSHWEHLEKVFLGKIVACEKHINADSLNVCQVEVCGETRQIVCGAPNARAGINVAVALPGAELKPGFIIKKSKIRGESSNGMICSEDELGLIDERQEGIMELPEDAPLGTCAKDYFDFWDIILEIDNKAINHRPDLFSHIGIAREIEAIRGKKLAYDMTKKDFSHLPDLGITNEIPQIVKRYMGLSVSGVSNIESPDYVKDVLASHDIEPKGLLVDVTNYSLYLYGQPTHCFDADKLTWNIHIRYAKDGESFRALNDKDYTLSPEDIVIADDAGVIALWGIIWGKDSAVSDSTKNIVIESAWFDQAVVRKTGKRLGIRTDALNVFEKDLVCSIRDTGPSLIIRELEEHCPDMEMKAFTDVYPEPTSHKKIDFNLDFINRLIGKEYTQNEVLTILKNISIEEENGVLTIPLWRKDLHHIADIAEEVARLDGYDSIKATVPRINLWAISQSPTYLAKRQLRNFFVSQGYYEMYTYSFVDASLMEKTLGNTENLVPLKNYLSEEMTHMRPSLIPNLLQALEDNCREYNGMKLFECEKVFSQSGGDISEYYELGCVMQSSNSIAYYDIQETLKELMHTLGVQKYDLSQPKNTPSYAHSGRSASIIVRGQEIGTLWEIHPKALKNFSLSERVWYISINLEKLAPALYGLIVAREVSSFQENNFDINFVVEKNTPGKNILRAIEKSSSYITKVELFDIFESEEKLPGKRSLSFKVYIQSLTETLDDKVKNQIIEDIIKNVEKVGGILR